MTRNRYWTWTLITAGLSAMTPSCGASNDDAAVENGEGAPDQAEAGEDVGVSDQALMGGLDFATSLGGLRGHLCNADERDGAIQTMILARTVARSQAFAECVTQAAARTVTMDSVGWGPYVRCSSEPRGSNATTIIAAARNPRPVSLVCDFGAQGGETFPSNGTGTHDRMSVSIATASELLETDDFNERMSEMADSAGTFVHEAIHNWGFDDATSRCGSDARKRASYIVGACVRNIVSESLNRCNVQACGGAAELNLLNGYPIANGTLASSVGCACVRDNPGPVQTAVPASPRLGTNDLDDNYGTSTATGDFNGDGFQDLAVGAPFDAGGQGRVYLYRGTAMGLYPWKVLSQGSTASNEAGDRFGFSLAAGRLDGDWFDDLAVGIPGEDNSAGAVLVFRGGSKDIVATRRVLEIGFNTPQAGDQFGISLVIGRFFDQTNAALAVGAHAEIVFGQPNGMVFVFQGSSDVSGSLPLSPVAYSHVESPTDAGAYGFSLAAGRIDSADLYDDLVIGDPTRKANAGAVHVVNGRPTQGAWFPSRRIDSPQGAGLQFFGYTVAVTDLVGVSGIAVGAPLSDSSKGRVHLFNSGGALWGGLLGNLQGGQFGLRVAAGRTPDELLIGAPNQVGGVVGSLRRTFEGGLNVFWGQALTQNDVAEATDKFGQAMAVGDFDADGDRDLAVGSPGEGLGNSPGGSGAVSLYRTDPSGTLVSWGIAHQAL